MMEPNIYSQLLTAGKAGVQEKKRRRLSLFLSLVFHSLVLLLSVKFFQPMGELFKEEDVRAVFLAETEDFYFPEEIIRSERLRNATEILPNQELQEGESQDIPTVTRQEVEGYLGSLYSRSVTADPVDIRIDPELLERFQLSPPQEDGFRLSIAKEYQSETEKSMKQTGPEKTRIDFLIPFAAGSNARLKKLLGSSSVPGRNSGADDPMPGGKGRFEIGDWAEEALVRIEKNWSVDPLLARSLKGIVGITLTIDKSGKIRSIEIVRFSGYASLDRIALNALEASDPLPGLPEDFSAQILVVYFEFEYGD